MNTVGNLRDELIKKVRAMETIDTSDVADVNRFSRLEMMQEKMRELMKYVAAFVEDGDHEYFRKLISEFEFMALDWVNGPEIKWHGSMAQKKANQIENELGKRTIHDDIRPEVLDNEFMETEEIQNVY